MTASTADSGLDGFLASPSASTPLTAVNASLLSGNSSSASSNGVGHHYWTVRLDCPPGGSAALKSFVGLAQTAIQTAVDLLGRGTPVTPPDVSDLMRPVIYEDLGQSESSVGYRHALSQIHQRQSALLTLDSEVLQTSVVVAASQDQTLGAIEQIVADLNDTLDSVGSTKLKAVQEQSLMWQIANAVDEVYKAVDSVAQQNQQIAGTASDSASQTGSSGTSGSGSGSGDMSGLMQLAMIPMTLASSLAPTIIQALQKQLTPHKDNGDDPNATGQTPPAATGGPAVVPAAKPAEPAAAAPATPATAAPAAANGNTPGTPTATPAMARRQRRERPRVSAPANGDAPADGTEEETTDEADAGAGTAT